MDRRKFLAVSCGLGATALAAVQPTVDLTKEDLPKMDEASMKAINDAMKKGDVGLLQLQDASRNFAKVKLREYSLALRCMPPTAPGDFPLDQEAIQHGKIAWDTPRGKLIADVITTPLYESHISQVGSLVPCLDRCVEGIADEIDGRFVKTLQTLCVEKRMTGKLTNARIKDIAPMALCSIPAETPEDDEADGVIVRARDERFIPANVAYMLPFPLGTSIIMQEPYPHIQREALSLSYWMDVIVAGRVDNQEITKYVFDA